jgi:hypothetical protein
MTPIKKFEGQPSLVTPMGTSPEGFGSIRTKAKDNINQLDKRKGGIRSEGVAGSGTSGTRAELIKTGKTAYGTGVLGFAERAVERGQKITTSRREKKPSDIPANIDPVKQVAGGTVRDKNVINPIVRGQLDVLNPPTKSLISGGRKAPHVPGQPTLREVSGEVEARKRRGEKRTGPGGFTDTGTFRRTNDGKTLREEAQAPGMFKTVRETMAANFKQNRASAVARGARADAKAVNAERKAYGDLYAKVAEVDPSSPILAEIQKRLKASFAPKVSENAEMAAILKIDPNMDRGTLKQIIAQRRGN